MNDCIGDNTLVEFVEGTLSAAQSSLLERHVARCNTCRHRVAAMGASPSRLALGPTPRVPDGQAASNSDSLIIDYSRSGRNVRKRAGYCRAPGLDGGGTFPEDDFAPALAPGSRVGGFEVRHEIGRGGMGVVFSARDPELDRPVALKLLHGGGGAEQTEQAQARLLAEARAMARLDHPHIVTVYGAGRYDTSAYIAMEMITGETLSSWLDRWRRPWQSILESFRQSGLALAHAHDHGLAHGDFKPENVLVDDTDHVRVTDFGLACHLENAFRPGRPGWVALPADAEAHPVMGTPRYMAPEQFRGHPADAASDQFSFCVALYEALYGHHPFARNTALALFELPDEEATQPLRSLVPKAHGVPVWLHQALCRGLSPEPAKRWSSMKALLQALVEPRTWHPVRSQHSRFAFIAAAMALVCVSGYALGAWYSASLTPRITPIATMSGPTSPLPSWLAAWPEMPLSNQQAMQPVVATADLMIALSFAAPDFIPARFSALRTILGAHGERRKSIVTLLDGTMVVLDQEIERIQDLRAAIDTLDHLLGKHEQPHLAAAAPGRFDAADPSGRSQPGDAPTDLGTLRTARNQPWRARARARGQRNQSNQRQPLSRGSRHRQARRNGLNDNTLKAGLANIRPDLEVCFREWRERQPQGRHPLAIRIAIDEYGAVQPRLIRGLDDSVVRKCTVGAIERAEFPRARQDTLAEVLFVSHKGKLDIVQRVVP